MAILRRDFLAGIGAAALAGTARAATDSGDEYHFTPSAAGRRAVGEWVNRKEIMRYDVDDVHAVHYAEVAVAHGVARLAAVLGDPVLLKLSAERWRKAAEIPNSANHVDANVIGAWQLGVAPLVQGAKVAGLALADAQWAETGADGLCKQARYWIDDVWMIGALQLEAWRATRERKYLDRAALVGRRYIEKLQQPGGLFHHGPQAPHYWARGNGWVAAGLAEILHELPRDHPDRAVVLAGYQKMMATLLLHQRKDGSWGQLIDNPEAWGEASGTAMFAFALLRGVNMGLLPKGNARAAALKAWTLVENWTDAEGRLDKVCVGTGQSADVVYYLTRPTAKGDLHGQAALLWLTAELCGTSGIKR